MFWSFRGGKVGIRQMALRVLGEWNLWQSIQFLPCRADSSERGRWWKHPWPSRVCPHRNDIFHHPVCVNEEGPAPPSSKVFQ
mmetsp:Transcript_7853/g.14802  ORF Transcript_7853/g.14802 Transcript_7853/m.14802 type:complete len:82 (-) Transcript_7853:1383-1628(-)